MRAADELARRLRVKIVECQQGIPTFFDNLVLGLLTDLWNDPAGPGLQTDAAAPGRTQTGLAEELLWHEQSLTQPRFSAYGARHREADSRPRLSWEMTDRQSASMQGVGDCLRWRGAPLFKTAFDFALYPMLLWETKPRTILELGSGLDTSARWLADLLRGFDIPGHVYSIDIRPPRASHPGVTFIGADVKQLDAAVPAAVLDTWAHPWIVIEDAHVNTRQVLTYLARFARAGDYFVVEDSGTKRQELLAFTSDAGRLFHVDTYYTDLFGRNATSCVDSILRCCEPS